MQNKWLWRQRQQPHQRLTSVPPSNPRYGHFIQISIFYVRLIRDGWIELKRDTAILIWNMPSERSRCGIWMWKVSVLRCVFAALRIVKQIFKKRHTRRLEHVAGKLKVLIYSWIKHTKRTFSIWILEIDWSWWTAWRYPRHGRPGVCVNRIEHAQDTNIGVCFEHNRSWHELNFNAALNSESKCTNWRSTDAMSLAWPLADLCTFKFIHIE